MKDEEGGGGLAGGDLSTQDEGERRGEGIARMGEGWRKGGDVRKGVRLGR